MAAEIEASVEPKLANDSHSLYVHDVPQTCIGLLQETSRLATRSVLSHKHGGKKNVITSSYNTALAKAPSMLLQGKGKL